MKRFLPLFAFACSFAPTNGQAESSRDFTPKIYSFYGEMSLVGFHKEEKVKGAQEASNERANMKELLELGVVGYAYHPSFVTFLARVSGGIEQERIELEKSSSKSVSSTEEYELRAFFLPNHPYSLELFSMLQRPLVTTSLVTREDPALYQSGMRLSYKKSPWTSLLGYTHQELDYFLTSTSDSYNANLAFTKRDFRTNALYLYRESTQSNGEEGNSSYYFINNEFKLGRARLDSELDHESTREEDKEGEEIETKQKTETNWLERISIDLPLRFSADASYRKNNLDTEYTPNFIKDRFNYRDYADFHIGHRLYNSLYSDLRLDRITTEFPEGKVEQKGFQLNESYRKILPPGLLSTSIWTGRREYSKTGEPSIIDSAYKATDAGLIVLPEDDIDEDTIRISASSPFQDIIPIEITEGVHYIINSFFQGTTEIRIIRLPVEFGNIFEFSKVDFFISYTLLPEHLKSRTKYYGFTIKLDLLDNLISPYYTHDILTTDFLEGNQKEEPERRERNTLGIIAQYKPFTYMIEYSNIESNRYPSRSWLTRIEYNQLIGGRTQLHLDAEYRKRTYPFDDRTNFEPISYDNSEDEVSITSRISKDISQSLNFNVDTRYRHLSTLQEIDFYSATSSLNWRFGQSRIEATIDFYQTDTNDPEGFDTKLTGKAVYLKYKRVLFQY